MGTVSFEVPGPGTYQVTCDPKLDTLANSGTAEDVLAGKQFYNDQNAPVTGTMPNNPPQQVSVAGGESYTIPRGYHDGTGKVTGTGAALPALTNPGEPGDLLKDKQLIDQSGNVVTGTLELGTSTSDATATAGDILAPKTAYVAAGKVTGTIATRGDSDVTASGPQVAVPAGYYPQAVNRSVQTAEPGTPAIAVDNAGEVTATVAQDEGYVPGSTKTAAMQLDTQGAQTLIPGTADQIIPAGKYLTGAQTVQGDANLLPENIKKGVSLFGVEGSYESGLPANVRTITLTADPPEGGSVFGGGVASDGMTLTVNAEAEEGHNFNSWQENGEIVSKDLEYTFTVLENRELTALFEKAGQHTPGVDWWGATLPSSAYWSGVTYGDGKFVAVVSNSNKAAYSTDGITWTATTLPSSAYWSGVTYGDGKFVAVVSGSNKAAYSTDGITWKAAALPSSASWSSVTYGGGKFVAVVSDSNKAAYSTSGITWKAATLPSSASWYGVAYGDGKFVAATLNDNKAAYSTDGITWKAATLPSSAYWYGVAYGDGKFVVVASSGEAAYSTGGITWKAATLPSSDSWSSVTYGDGKFVAVARGSNQAAYSTDGITWKATTLPSSASWYGVAYGDGKFVAVAGLNSDKAAYSSARGPEA